MRRSRVQTRQLILDAAYGLFCDLGYNATTMDAVAKQAGVAVQTVYFTFHTKDALLQEVQDRAVIGDDRVPPPDQPWFAEAIAAPDGVRALAAVIGGVADIHARVAPLVPVFHAVAGEPAGGTWRRAEALRREGFAQLLDLMVAKTPLRQDLGHDHALDLLFVVLGTELYKSLVIDCGWSPAAWSTWVLASLSRDLFGQEPAARPLTKRATKRATKGPTKGRTKRPTNESARRSR